MAGVGALVQDISPTALVCHYADMEDAMMMVVFLAHAHVNKLCRMHDGSLSATTAYYRPLPLPPRLSLIGLFSLALAPFSNGDAFSALQQHWLTVKRLICIHFVVAEVSTVYVLSLIHF